MGRIFRSLLSANGCERDLQQVGWAVHIRDWWRVSRICDAANLQCTATLLAYSVLGDTADALIVDGTSIPRGNGLGNGAWGPANTSSSGNSGIPQGSGFGYNPKTTTLLTGLGTYTYDVTNLPALKGKLTWVQNLAYDGTDSSHRIQRLCGGELGGRRDDATDDHRHDQIARPVGLAADSPAPASGPGRSRGPCPARRRRGHAAASARP